MKLSIRQDTILNCIKNHERATSVEIGSCVSLPAATVRREIQALRQKGIVVKRKFTGYAVQRSF